MNRREFLFSAGAVTLLQGCRAFDIFGAPDMSFGVVSDIHITTPKSCKLVERAFRYFRKRNVDAVLISGDLTDWGLRSGFIYLKQTWDKVFKGTEVVPLFCTGNHDFDGWWYGDMTMEMHANGYHEEEAISKLGVRSQWEEILGEPWDWIRVRTVKGYDFVSAEFEKGGSKHLADWMTANGGRFKNDRPFFFFQHLPIYGTTIDSLGGRVNGGVAKSILSNYPNCVAFTGHTHRPFIDERQIWQGEFTAIASPSLSYASYPAGYENGSGNRTGKSKQAMPIIPSRLNLRGGEGFVVNVWSDKIVVERRDLEEGEEGAPAWVIPLPLGKEKPFADGVRNDDEPVPSFPSAAELDIETRNSDNRSGYWTIVMNCEFPSAIMPNGHRVHHYEIKAVPKDGSEPLVKRYFSPAYPKMAKFEPARQRFWFDVAELPQDKEYVIEVRAYNCFDKASAPLISPVLRGRPGLGEAKRDAIHI